MVPISATQKQHGVVRGRNPKWKLRRVDCTGDTFALVSHRATHPLESEHLAYIDERFAVLPLGCSCQSNQQINVNSNLIGRALGSASPRRINTYFDWLVCPSISLEKMVADGLPVPEGLSDIGWARGRPEFLRYGALFYHEFINSSKEYEYTLEGFLRLQGKFTHTSKNLADSAASKEAIFIWSNTQNNLTRVANECDGLDLLLTEEVIERVVAAGDQLSGQHARYVFVTYEDRNVVADFKHPRATIRVLRRDSSTWEGDAEQWAEVFRSLNPEPQSSGPGAQGK
jgi:hypothetical protein